MNGWNQAANAEKPAGADNVVGTAISRGRLALTAPGTLLLVLFTLLPDSGCWSQSAPPRPTASNRLHLVAVLYGKYVSAHDGEMPANEADLVKYVDTSEREVLQRRSMKSAEEMFALVPGQSRLVVLYRNERERLGTNYVAIEEQKIQQQEGNAQGGDKKRPSRWFAADPLGAGEEISEEEARKLLAGARATGG